VNVTLAYGKTGLEISLPDDLNVTVVEPIYTPGLPNESEAIKQALRNPIDSSPLNELVKPSDKVGIIFSDITRPTPYRTILPVILNELEHVPVEQIILFNSTGTHRQNTDSELRGILGNDIVTTYKIVQNDANNRDSHELVGSTSSGNQIWLHKEYIDCDFRIPTGFIEPHFFAGFSGGGKAIMPGLALLETIMRNHSAKNMDSSKARWGITASNPLWEEVFEAATLVPPQFIVNITLNRDKEITGVFAGDFSEAHKQGCQFVKKSAMVPVDQRFDIVVGSNSGFPLDLNLYQSVKGMSAAAQIVKDQGAIIIAADCWDGIPEHGEYAKLLQEADSPKQLLNNIRSPGFHRQDMWQAQMQAIISQKASVYFYSHNLSNEQIEKSLLNPCNDIEAIIMELLDHFGPKANICILPEGPQTIPYISE
jgi:lactate racemase